MSEISTYLTKIKNAVYGREVRTAIHDAIDTMNKDAKKLDAQLTDRMIVVEICADEAMEKAQESKGGYVLWKGASFPGSKVEFSIPEMCFHHNRTTITLMIETYTVSAGDNAPVGNVPIFVTLICGTLKDLMGSDLGMSFNPYSNEFGYATNDMYTNVHIKETVVDLLKASVRVKKTVDSRYAVGVFSISNDSDDELVVTSISALIPTDLEVSNSD